MCHEGSSQQDRQRISSVLEAGGKEYVCVSSLVTADVDTHTDTHTQYTLIESMRKTAML